MSTRKIWNRSVLGHGSFGDVSLFTSNNGDQIALKEMKVETLRTLNSHERDKMIVRLRNEIKIMWEHDHPNLIKALGPPQDIPYYPPEDVMHVWMEYCNGGDLRNGVLKRYENCCGVEERQFRKICGDINNGIRFLHKISVIHRDLKPENILIKHIDANTVVYKLTDFGYAKTYGLSSKAKSLVGTPQYVAPEIIDQDSHGRPVDFWSFGVVAFELVTGIRPFLHKSKRPLEWVGPTGNKDDNCIYITLNNREIEYYDSIPSPYQLSSAFAGELTKWLQVVLHQEPERRGVAHNGEEAPCLLHIDRILKTKVLTIVSMSKGHVLSYIVREDSSYQSLSTWLEEKGYPRSKQYLVTDKGELLSDSVLDLHSSLKWDDCVCTVYLFSQDVVPSFKLVEQVTPSVMNLITNGDEKLHREDRYMHFAHAYSHIKDQERLFWRIHKGHISILQLIRPVTEELKGSYDDHSTEFSKCLGVAHFMKKMYSEDMEKLSDDSRINTWKSELSKLDQAIEGLHSLTSEIHALHQEIGEELTKCEVMNEAIISSRDQFKDFNTSCVSKALDIIKKEKAHESHYSMADLLTRSTLLAENIIQDHLNRYDFLKLYLQLKRLIERRKSIKPEIDQLEMKCSEINDTLRKEMWSLIGIERRSSTFDVTQSLNNSVFNGSGFKYARSSSVTSCHSILLRMKSQSSVSSESIDAGDEELQSLVGSLKNEIMNMCKMSSDCIHQNEDIRRTQISTKVQSSESHSVSPSQ